MCARVRVCDGYTSFLACLVIGHQESKFAELSSQTAFFSRGRVVSRLEVRRGKWLKKQMEKVRNQKHPNHFKSISQYRFIYHEYIGP